MGLLTSKEKMILQFLRGGSKANWTLAMKTLAAIRWW